MHCCISIATIVKQMCYTVILHIHCLSS